MYPDVVELGKYNPKSTFLKVSIIIFISLLFFLLIIGAILLFLFASQIDSAAESAALKQLLADRNSIDRQIDNIVEYSVFNNLNYGDIIAYQFSDQNSHDGLTLNQMLQDIKDSNEDISEVLLYFESSQEVFTTRASYNSDLFFQRVYFFQLNDLNTLMSYPSTDEQLDIIYASEFVYYSQYDEQLLNMSSLVFKLPINTQKDNIALIVLLSEDSLFSIEKPSFADKSISFLFNTNGSIIKRTNKNITLYSFKNSQIMKTLSIRSSNSGTINASIDNENYNIYYAKSLSSDLILTTLVPKNYGINTILGYLQNSLVWLWVLLLLFILVSMVTTLLIRKISLSINSNEIKKERFNRSILNILNEADDEDSQKDGLAKLSKILPKGNSNVNILQIDMYKETGISKSEILNCKTKYDIQKTIENYLKDFSYKYIFFNDNRFIILITNPNNNSFIIDKIKDDFERIICKIYKAYSISATAGIGLPVSNKKNIYISAKQALLALNNRVFSGSKRVYVYSEKHIPENRISYLTKAEQNALQRNIRIGNMLELNSIVDSISSRMTNCYESEIYIKEIYKQILFICFTCLDNQKNSVPFMSYYKMYEKIDKCITLDDMRRYVLDQCKKIIGIISENEVKMSSKESSRNYIQYIEENYSKDVTLDDISAHFNLSPSYFSRHFKEIIGTNLIHYINSYRIDMAKKLLLKTKKNIYEIAKEVGFNNYNSFSRAFKDRTGSSPEAYKKNITNDLKDTN